MTPARAIVRESRRSFDLFGRTARAGYLWSLATAILACATVATMLITVLSVESVPEALYVTTALFYLPVTAAGVRRLHDVGQSGTLMFDPLKPAAIFLTFLLILWLFPTLGGLVNAAAMLSAMFFSQLLVSLLAVLGLAAISVTLMYFSNTMAQLLLPSQPGPNRYGPNPNEVTQ
ncbi:DUF805 domain-containing protein [Puniceibacterium sp. IMCC21224]|uniref:DUF805 domain-containing protein n=1 Tax=Puniceibacterium sp. IMCC21224 TaxID=1618204 RepID=UPI00064E0230|nr:DUF805 domain-containing protein [Puniceibacterium sp. IMCC21224]KMK66343.1 hypothetical protein IMCC21224_111193 [Puniceibacterium sp. IMCC21224]